MQNAKLYYRWNDEDGNERITPQKPINACRSWMGGSNYTPDYKKVVVIDIEGDED